MSIPSREGHALREWRMAKSWSPTDLAWKLWISRRTVGRWERGELAIPVQYLRKLRYWGFRPSADRSRPALSVSSY